jgi:hypothetical protein
LPGDGQEGRSKRSDSVVAGDIRRSGIIRKLREADRQLGEDQDVALVAKQLEVSEQPLHRCWQQYGGLKGEPRSG